LYRPHSLLHVSISHVEVHVKWYQSFHDLVERAATAEREKPKADYQTETQLEAIAEEELSGSGRTTAMSDLQSVSVHLLYHL
jgi:hypothetical protein